MSWAVWITARPEAASHRRRAVADRLRSDGDAVTVLEMMRSVACHPSPTYSDDEREAVYRALVYIGASLVGRGQPVIFDATAHRRAWRDLARATIDHFAEVQLHCPLSVCRQREAERPRGTTPAAIYARSAQPGARVPGVNVEYEVARAPELEIDTATHPIEASAAAIVELICRRFSSRDLDGLRAEGPDDDGLAARLLVAASDYQRAIGDRARAWVARDRMVDEQIAARGIADPAVLQVMRAVPREQFVRDSQAPYAYDDSPLPIGEGQTISQPYIVAVMTEAIRPRSGERALEVGTGSGYAAAVLSRLVGEVYTIERVKRLAEAAELRLRDLGYVNVHLRHGDGRGWPEHAPYDGIIATAGGPDIPPSPPSAAAAAGW
jgi:protein-L-isoaspartate(D-aspartate) O-methyltransferase